MFSVELILTLILGAALCFTLAWLVDKPATKPDHISSGSVPDKGSVR
jgi:hypothetical protein